MSEIILDFIQCHYCEKRFEPDDPKLSEHWRECRKHPIHKLIAACEAFLVWNDKVDAIVDCPPFLINDIRKALL